MGVAAIIVLWLVFSVLKKVFGLVFLVALVAGGFYLWNNPEMAQFLMTEGRKLLANWT